MGGNQQELLSTTGTAFHFQQFVPAIGFLSGSIEAYGNQNRFQTGENFLQLRGAPWAGHYWTITAGDFHAPASLVDLPFNNIYTPQIEARGISVQAVHGATQYTFFAGQETLMAGARVSYRVASPQTLMGLSAVHRIAPHLMVGARLTQFSTSPQGISENSYLFPAGRTAGRTRTMAIQSLYTPVERLKLYAEVSRPDSSTEHPVTSAFAGLAWEDGLFSLKANYAYQGLYYFPLAGYFAGDRRGPYGEVRLRPRNGLELFATASQYRNNLEHNPTLPSMASTGISAGISELLPGKVSLSGQVSSVGFTGVTSGEPDTISNNRQISAALSRGFGRQTVQVNWREILMDTGSGLQRQRSSEAGDMFQFRRFTLGASVRYQQVTGTNPLNSLFYRVMGQVQAGRVNIYANLELGNDLANQTVFSTEAYRTSVIGASVRLPGKWTLQTELFRNTLNVALNPENIFLMGNGDALSGMSPVAATLSAMSQWSLYFRLSRHFRWGGGAPQENAVRPAAAVVSLKGSIEGLVRLRTMARPLDGPAASIPVVLDHGRTVLTGVGGHYVFEGVAEGAHEVALAVEELPADFDPGVRSRSSVVVQPRRIVRADFEVLPLMVIEGRLWGPEKAELKDVIVRLLPGERYTSTDKDGVFRFYNVREGDYSAVLDAQTLPDGGELQSPGQFPVAVRIDSPALPVNFSFHLKSTQKPVRKVLDRK
jgi:hypothetical protein